MDTTGLMLQLAAMAIGAGLITFAVFLIAGWAADRTKG